MQSSNPVQASENLKRNSTSNQTCEISDIDKCYNGGSKEHGKENSNFLWVAKKGRNGDWLKEEKKRNKVEKKNNKENYYYYMILLNSQTGFDSMPMFIVDFSGFFP